jgi:hypothetical protein
MTPLLIAGLVSVGVPLGGGFVGYDQDGDNLYDAYTVDRWSDGTDDMFLLDQNENGVFESYMLDWDNDGAWYEFVVYDMDENGMPNIVGWDLTPDWIDGGSLEVINWEGYVTDHDQDGIMDHTETIANPRPMPSVQGRNWLPGLGSWADVELPGTFTGTDGDFDDDQHTDGSDWFPCDPGANSATDDGQACS